MTAEIKTIRRSLENASSFEQFKLNFLGAGGQSAEGAPMKRDAQIRKLLTEVGIQDHLLGYEYITMAIGMVLDDREYIGNITGGLYPDIAERCGTYPSRVERAMRHAIETAFLCGDPDALERFFGSTISAKSGKATNSQFIARMANIIRDRM